VDPVKLREDEDRQLNLVHLVATTTQFFEAIINSIEDLPIPILCICYDLGQAVQEKYSENYLVAIGGFLFLRFICPAILLPNTSGILEEDEQLSEKAKRGLLLIAKCK
jgi:hypothetical protein